MLGTPKRIYPETVVSNNEGGGGGGGNLMGNLSADSTEDIIVPSSTRAKPLLKKNDPIPRGALRHRMSSRMSFTSQASSHGDQASSTEALINYLTSNIDALKQRENLHKFEAMSAEVLLTTHDAELHRIFKSHGWIGSRYRSSDETPLEAQSLLQALSNFYLRNKGNNFAKGNLFGVSDEKGADEILSFCPDLLLTALKARDNQRIKSKMQAENVTSHVFQGACMLADISGFSKFSGKKCSEGVRGLDELREVTNGFLGYIVKCVYAYYGDGKAPLAIAFLFTFLTKFAFNI
jgi:hypothetical protein